MRGLGRPGWLFPHKRVEHVCIWPPGSATVVCVSVIA